MQAFQEPWNPVSPLEWRASRHPCPLEGWSQSASVARPPAVHGETTTGADRAQVARFNSTDADQTRTTSFPPGNTTWPCDSLCCWMFSRGGENAILNKRWIVNGIQPDRMPPEASRIRAPSPSSA
eukprot:gene12013-biopygen15461